MITYFEDDYLGKNIGKIGDVKLKITEFGSTEIKIECNDIEKIKNKSIVFVYSPFVEKEPCRDYKLLMALNYIKEYSHKITLFSPYLSNSRQDKKTPNKEEGIALKHWIYLLKQSGVSKIVSFDIHSKKTEEYCKEQGIKFINIKHRDIFKDVLKTYKIDVIVAPDKGAKERARELAISLKKPYVILEKKRDYEKGKIKEIHYRGERLEGKKVLLVDDIISSGGTIVKSLETLGVKKALLAITHSTLSKRGYENLEILYKKGMIERLITTNSFPIKRKSYIEIIKLNRKKVSQYI